MTGINHALTGAFAATAINRPVLSLPAALVSHFVVDGLPHWDYKLRTRALKRVVTGIDVMAGLLLLMALSILLFAASPFLVIAGGVLGMLPDALSFKELLKAKHNRKEAGFIHRLQRLHDKVHWSEPKFGLLVEIVWFFLMMTLIFHVG